MASDHPPELVARGGDPRGPLSFTLTADDVVDAYRLQAKARLWSLTGVVSFLVSVVVVAVFLVFAMRGAPVLVIVGICVGAVLGGVLFPLAMIRWRIPPLARRIYRQQRGLHGEVTFDWDDEAISVSTVRSHGRLPWADYLRWREDARMVLLYQSDAIFQMLPKRALTPEVLTAFRSHARHAGVQGLRRE